MNNLIKLSLIYVAIFCQNIYIYVAIYLNYFPLLWRDSDRLNCFFFVFVLTELNCFRKSEIGYIYNKSFEQIDQDWACCKRIKILTFEIGIYWELIFLICNKLNSFNRIFFGSTWPYFNTVSKHFMLDTLTVREENFKIMTNIYIYIFFRRKIMTNDSLFEF